MGKVKKSEIQEAPLWPTPKILTLETIPDNERLDDIVVGYLALCAKTRLIVKKGLGKYQFVFERDGKLRKVHSNTRAPFTSPNGLQLVLNG